MISLEEALKNLKTFDQSASDTARKRMDSLAKPIHSLGDLEELIIQCAGIFGSAHFSLKKKCVAVLCADNGLTARQITANSSAVTAIMAENFAKNSTSVCKMAEVSGADVIVVDIGVASDLQAPNILRKKVAYGTDDMTQGPAMTRDQAVQAIETGLNLAIELKEQGYQMIATGEMGIGNTSTSSAMTAALLRLNPEQITGYGAGVSEKGLSHKIHMIQKSLQVNQPNADDPIDVLAKVGGLDIGGMCGLFIGGAYTGVPIVIDGLISAISALTAFRIAPQCRDYMLPSHMPYEPGGKYILDALGVRPLIHARLCLGEGTGAVATFPWYDMMMNIYENLIEFKDLM